jgi:hypothetical protein
MTFRKMSGDPGLDTSFLVAVEASSTRTIRALVRGFKLLKAEDTLRSRRRLAELFMW